MTDKPKKSKLKSDETNYAPISAHAGPSPSAEASIVTIPADDIQILQELGRGSYGVVSLGLYRGQPVAVKKLLNSMLSTQLDELFVNLTFQSTSFFVFCTFHRLTIFAVVSVKPE